MKTWENAIRHVIPYVPGEQPKQENIIKLNTNENPYPPSPRVAEVLKQLTTDTMRKYPDVNAQPLVGKIAKAYHLSEDQVFVGVGSDDVLAMCFLTFFNSSKPILFPDITYSFYDVWADLFRIPYEQQPLDENFKIRVEDYEKENGGIIFPNPNAPTGAQLPLEQVEEIIKKNKDVIVIIDEAYIDFGGDSALKLIDRYENLLVVQTFSKSRSMAGMRIGYAMGNPVLIHYLNDVKYSFNSYTMNEVTLKLGAAAIEDEEYFKETTAKIIQTREQARQRFLELGFTCVESKANFLFVSHRSCPAEVIFEALKKEGIYVRYWNKPRINQHLRVTIGTKEQMEALFSFLEKFLKSCQEKQKGRMDGSSYQ